MFDSNSNSNSSDSSNSNSDSDTPIESGKKNQRHAGGWTKEATIAAAKEVVEKHGDRALTSKWLQTNGFNALASAISKHGGYTRIRAELGLQPLRKQSPNRKPMRRTKPLGYWSDVANVIAEAKEIVAKHGLQTLTGPWLRKNGYSYLNPHICKHGGYTWIRQELGQEPRVGNSAHTWERVPSGYWNDADNVIAAAKEIVAKHGPEAISSSWLDKNGYSGLVYGTKKHGGMSWIKKELEMEPVEQRSNGYWTEEKIFSEAKVIIQEHGEKALTQGWLNANNYGGMVNALGKGKGFIQLKKDLEPWLEANGYSCLHKRQATSTPASRRCENIEQMKAILRDLQAEGVGDLTPAQMMIILQQGGYDKLPMDEGKDIFTAVTKGSLLPKTLIEWSLSEEPEPPIEVKDETAAAAPAPVAPTAPASTEQQTTEQQPAEQQPTEDDQTAVAWLPALAMQDAEAQLRLLDSEVIAGADDEALEALTSIALHELWAKAYVDKACEEATVAACQNYDAKRPWSRRVQAEFLRQYAGARAIELPVGFAFTVEGQQVEPRLMQLHVAFLAQERRRFLILSDMGTGKSLAAQLSVVSAGAKRILVLPINACGHQWSKDFNEQWHGIKVHEDLGRHARSNGRRALVLPDTASAGPHVWVVPIHLLSAMDDQDVLDLVEGFQPDAVILDEVQYLKQRHDDAESARRRQAAKVLCLTTEANPEAMVLSLSGTAVVNNLTEARKLIELTLCEERPDLNTAVSAANAMRMHQALMAHGIRQRSTDQFSVEIRRPQVDASAWLEQVAAAHRYPARQRPLELEKVLIEARIPEIVAAINGPTVVATQYVEGFVGPLRKALEAAGHRVGIHTGEEKLPVHGHLDAIEAFKAGAVDVLLASINTMGTGVDGLQRICNNLVIASMPWTAADYLQLIARLARSGQKSAVTVTIPTTSIDYVDQEEGPSRWSFCGYRAAVIAKKKRLMDAVMDGLIPDADDITEAAAGEQLGHWLRRLGSTGALVRNRRPITVPLKFASAVEELKARKSFGDWSSCNGRWNSVNSAKLHARLQRDPQEWELYHTDLEKLRLQWSVDPLQEAINWCAKSSNLTIGDFGCGTAQLAEALRGRHTVHSFDHIAINDSVVECDIAAGVPLEDGCLDLAIFSLSLMGQNWTDQLVEARRCLKPTGQLLVWTAANGKDPEEYAAQVDALGFKAIHSKLHSKWLHLWSVRTETGAASATGAKEAQP